MAALSGGPMIPRGVPERLVQINAVARLPPTIAHGATCFRHRGSGRDRDDHPQRRCDRIRGVRLVSRLRVQREDLSKASGFRRRTFWAAKVGNRTDSLAGFSL